MDLARTNQRVFWVFAAMRQRCTNPSNPAFHNYGGRGITVDSSWNTFSQFLVDMGPRPDGYTLERIDNNKGYSKDNCKWASRAENCLNKRRYRTNNTGISGVVVRGSGFRVRIRRSRVIVLDKTVGDFFEACCIAKSFQLGDINHGISQ